MGGGRVQIRASQATCRPPHGARVHVPMTLGYATATAVPGCSCPPLALLPQLFPAPPLFESLLVGAAPAVRMRLGAMPTGCVVPCWMPCTSAACCVTGRCQDFSPVVLFQKKGCEDDTHTHTHTHMRHVRESTSQAQYACTGCQPAGRSVGRDSTPHASPKTERWSEDQRTVPACTNPREYVCVGAYLLCLLVQRLFPALRQGLPHTRPEALHQHLCVHTHTQTRSVSTRVRYA